MKVSFRLLSIMGFVGLLGSSMGCFDNDTPVGKPSSHRAGNPTETKPNPNSVSSSGSFSEKLQSVWSHPATPITLTAVASILGVGALLAGGSKLAYHYNWFGFEEKVDAGRFYLKGDQPDSLASRWFGTPSYEKDFIVKMSVDTLKGYVAGNPPRFLKNSVKHSSVLKPLIDDAIDYANQGGNWQFNNEDAWAHFVGNLDGASIAEVLHFMYGNMDWIDNNVVQSAALKNALLFYAYFKATNQLHLFQ